MSDTKPEVQDGDDSRTVHLVSGEGESFDVPLSVAKMSELVKTMITEDQDDDDVQEIPLPNVKSSILAKVIVFAQHYKIEAMTEIEKVRYLTIIELNIGIMINLYCIDIKNNQMTAELTPSSDDLFTCQYF